MSTIHGPRYDSGNLAFGEAAGVSRVRNRRSAASLTIPRRDGGLLTAAAHGDVPSYVYAATPSLTVETDIFVLIAGALGIVARIQRVTLVNPGAATVAANVLLSMGMATANGSGGADVSTAVLAVDAGVRGFAAAEQGGGPDGATPLSCRANDTTLGAGFVASYDLGTFAVPGTLGPFTPVVLYSAADYGTMKPLTLAAGNALILRGSAVGAGAAGMRIRVEFTADVA